jgi:AcrR family transcriptional regulator
MSDEAADFAGVQEPAGWQAQKSAATRNLIVEAAARCIIEAGYARTTTIAIAEKAGLSRGAMLHHFPAKLDVVRATIEFLFRSRLASFRRALARGARPDEDRVRVFVAGCWAEASQPALLATSELALAARSERGLAAAVAPAQVAYAREWRDLARVVLRDPDGSAAPADTTLDLCRCIVDGLAVDAQLHPAAAASGHVVRNLEALLRPLLRGTLTP